MTAPTLNRVKTTDGFIWEIAFAGMIKYHTQNWQAVIFYYQALEYYHQRDVGSLSNLQLSQDSILDAASTSPTIPSAPSGDCK
jgi:hypothetical protein